MPVLCELPDCTRLLEELVIHQVLAFLAFHLRHNVLFRLELFEVEVAIDEAENVDVVLLHLPNFFFVLGTNSVHELHNVKDFRIFAKACGKLLEVIWSSLLPCALQVGGVVEACGSLHERLN